METQRSETWTISDGIAHTTIEERYMVVSCEDGTLCGRLFEDGDEYCLAYVRMQYTVEIERFTGGWHPLKLLARIYDEMYEDDEGDDVTEVDNTEARNVGGVFTLASGK